MTILASLRTGSRRLEERKGIASVKAGSQNQAGSPTGWFLARDPHGSLAHSLHSLFVLNFTCVPCM